MAGDRARKVGLPATGRRASRDRGITLVELLVALGLFLALSFTLYGFVRGGLRMWRTGERGMSFAERSQVVLDLLSEDLQCAYVPPAAADGAPIARFLCDLGADAEGKLGPYGSRLRFVRAIGDELYDPETRGTPPPAPAAEKKGLAAQVAEVAKAAGIGVPRVPGGLVEIAWTVAGSGGGPGTLYRGRLFPLGRTDSFFEKLPATREEADERLIPVLDGVLRFQLLFDNQTTSSQATALTGTSGGRDAVWDSTRGLLKGFSLFQGPESTLLARDDVFPSAAQLKLVLTRPNDASFGTSLRQPIEEADQVLPVASLDPLKDLRADEVLVDEEWIRLSVGSSRDVKIVERGAYGTRPASHRFGATVWVGTTTTARIEIPCHREDWNR